MGFWEAFPWDGGPSGFLVSIPMSLGFALLFGEDYLWGWDLSSFLGSISTGLGSELIFGSSS